MHKLPRVVRHLFCEDGAQAMEERSDSAVFGKTAGGEAGAVASLLNHWQKESSESKRGAERAR